MDLQFMCGKMSIQTDDNNHSASENKLLISHAVT